MIDFALNAAPVNLPGVNLPGACPLASYEPIIRPHND